jgi:hypothetical protein
VRTNLWLLAILVSSMSPTGFQVRHQPGRLRGIVTDQVGEVIPLAAVLVHPDPQMTKLREALDFGEDIRLQANQKGEFTATLAAGVYDVVVFAHVFSPQCAKVRITERGVEKRDFVLHVDPVVTQLIPD